MKGIYFSVCAIFGAAVGAIAGINHCLSVTTPGEAQLGCLGFFFGGGILGGALGVGLAWFVWQVGSSRGVRPTQEGKPSSPELPPPPD